MVKNQPAMLETQVQSLSWKDPLGESNGNPIQYSCLENSIDRGAWGAIVHVVAKSQTQLSVHTHFKKTSSKFHVHRRSRVVD